MLFHKKVSAPQPQNLAEADLSPASKAANWRAEHVLQEHGGIELLNLLPKLQLSDADTAIDLIGRASASAKKDHFGQLGKLVVQCLSAHDLGRHPGSVAILGDLVKHYPEAIAFGLRKLEIKDAELNLRVADALVPYHWCKDSNIGLIQQLYLDEVQFTGLALKVAAHNPASLVKCIEHWKIESETHRVQIVEAALSTYKGACFIAGNYKSFGISNQKSKAAHALACAKYGVGLLLEYAPNFALAADGPETLKCYREAAKLGPREVMNKIDQLGLAENVKNEVILACKAALEYQSTFKGKLERFWRRRS